MGYTEQSANNVKRHYETLFSDRGCGAPTNTELDEAGGVDEIEYHCRDISCLVTLLPAERGHIPITIVGLSIARGNKDLINGQ